MNELSIRNVGFNLAKKALAKKAVKWVAISVVAVIAVRFFWPLIVLGVAVLGGWLWLKNR